MTGLPAGWRCPKCGPRLVSRDLRHSCGQYRLEDYGPRWRAHHVLIRAEPDLDDELRAWLQEAHDTVGMRADLRPPPHNGVRLVSRVMSKVLPRDVRPACLLGRACGGRLPVALVPLGP